MIDPIQSGPYFHWIDGTRVFPTHVKDNMTTIVLIHGFTSHGRYLKHLGDFLVAANMQTLVFSYQSWRGISEAADNLTALVQAINAQSGGRLCRRKLVLIGHSMGGLVARAAVLQKTMQKLVRGVAALGTPNDGAVADVRIIRYFINLSEYMSGCNVALDKTCQTARELVKLDGPPSYIDEMNRRWLGCTGLPEYISISGGYAKF